MKHQEASNSRFSLVIADDHAVVRKGLQVILEIHEGIQVVSVVGTALEAVAAVELHKPQVVLLDLLLPDQAASQTVEQIKSISPSTQVVILTSHDGREYVADVLKAGALSYVLKDINPEELIQVLHKAAAGESMLDARMAKEFVGALSHGGSCPHDSLTEREWEVLRFIASGLSNGEIGKKLYISEPTVKSHVSSILGKLYLGDRTKAAVYAWEKGLMKK